MTVLNSPSLLSYDRKNVFVLVDGVPSSAEMLRTYQAGDIRDVEYYDTAPARYRIYTEGPLVNVRLRRRHNVIRCGACRGGVPCYGRRSVAEFCVRITVYLKQW